MQKSIKHYEELEWIVEKQLSVEDNIYIKNYSKQNLFVYIIKNNVHNYRMGLLSHKHLFLNQKINGLQLNFHSGDLGNNRNYEIIKDDFNKDFLKITNSKTKKCKSFVPKNMFFQSIYKDKQWLTTNKWKIHTKKFCTFKDMWFKQHLQNLGIKNPAKKIMKDLLNKAVVDTRIIKVVKSQFFITNSSSYMYQNSHSIIMTNGGTGKSSIIGILGQNLDETSNAGIYGYYSTNKDIWNSGIVSQTNSSIIIDELNELIKKQNSSNDGILATLNKPLENGTYNYGKAGGKQIHFGNQFIFLANVTDDFYFENLLTGMAGNVQTIGRRFAYILYDDKVEFIKGGRRINAPTQLMQVTSEYLSYIFKYLIDVKNIDSRIVKRKEIQKLLNTYKQKFINLIRGIEYEASKQVLESYVKSSLDTRLISFAIKIALFDKFGLFLEHNDLKKFDFTRIFNDIDKVYEDLLKDIEISIKNIVNHLENCEIKDSSESLHKKEIKKLSKNQKILLEKLHLEYIDKPFVKIYYESLKNKSELRFYIRDLKKYDSFARQNIELNNFGISINKKNNDVFFTITNKNLFNKYKEIFLDIENSDMPKNKFKDNSEIDEIDVDLI